MRDSDQLARLVGGDDLPLDDRAYGWFPPRRTLRVVLVGDEAEHLRAEEATARAESEKARADALAAEVARLKALIQK